MKTFSEFLSEVMQTAFPEGEPENLVSQHRADVAECLAFLQRHCDCYSTKNVDVYPFCSTFYQCSMTVVGLPYKSRVQNVFTMPEGNKWCCPIFGEYIADYDVFINRVNRFRGTLKNNDGQDLGGGVSIADSSTDKDWRANFFHYTIHRARLYVFPHIESKERLGVDWHGVRLKWRDTDYIPLSYDFDDSSQDDGIELRTAIAAKVLAEHHDRYTQDSNMADRQMAKWKYLVQELIWDCRQTQRPSLKHQMEYRGLFVGENQESECDPGQPTEENAYAGSITQP